MKTIPLAHGKVALVDDEDFERVNQFKWYADKPRYIWYAVRREGRTKIKLHQFIFPGYKLIDHKNRDGLDCRKENLRPATNSQNAANMRIHQGASSCFRGVSWHSPLKLWRTQICYEKIRLHLGYYEFEEDAAHVYDYAARIYFGEFARINFP